MRRLAVAVLGVVLVASGCKDSGPPPTVVATAAGQQLSVDQLAKVMVAMKGVPLAPEAADFLANIWVDHTLLAQALAHGRDFTDSATAAQILWPELVEARGTRWHDTLLARMVPLTEGVVDSIYGGDQVRLLQHILVRVEPNAEPPARAAAKQRAQRTLARVQQAGPGKFGQLASELSEDPASRRDSGYLTPAPRGRWVTAFDSAGWTLAPGQMTGLVETPFGYHIIRRPPVDEIRGRLVGYAREQLGQQLDATYLDSLGIRKHLELVSNAPALVREALDDKGEAIRSTKKLATYDGGAFTVASLVRWVTGLGPEWSADLGGQADTALTRFVTRLAQNQILIEQADSAGITVGPEEWQSLNHRYHELLDTLRLNLDLASPDLTDPAVPAEQRARVAALKVQGFWDRVVGREVRPRPMPGPVAYVLREDADYHVDKRGVAAAVARAQQLYAGTDTTGAKKGK